MKLVPVAHRAMDLTRGGRVFNACWLSGGCGLSIFQMLLLAQAWRESGQAKVPALLASAWTLGSLVDARCSAPARLWGCGCLACALLWLGSPALVAWRLPQALGLQPVLVGMLALALLAVVLGACGTAWLAQPRAWPAAGEKTALVRSLVGLTAGLLVAWMLPASGGFIALACCLPLLVLDTFLSGRAPLAPPDGMVARWMDRYWSAARGSVQLERHGVLPRWHGLSQRDAFPPAHRLPFILLASAVAVVLGSVWGAVPTPFASSLHASHSLDVLGFLLGGQLVALAVGTCCLLAVRGGDRFPRSSAPTRLAASRAEACAAHATGDGGQPGSPGLAIATGSLVAGVESGLLYASGCRLDALAPTAAPRCGSSGVIPTAPAAPRSGCQTGRSVVPRSCTSV